ncbi:MAG TPA: bacterioferritin [Amaricoccus sp.]|uniref:bacterioferritin n=1 Tax=Amaricoccus sp. TaxID=1872485 RepID=UPI002B5A585F|nr:bacterioferritin [Amaricoccus sp.]HMQ91951.1 bacterioferritin [Amaricoccus sp.]HMR53034.1 bacterioferritin [Amaricoccus sp.]HMR59159.1 bacterioferritin [Amaricoccus sp.]HMT99912.1 bacterioferritin [Amaricoccus sp.]
MKGNPKVIDLLNDALRHELTAVSQFWLHYRLLQNWGFGAMAQKWRDESIEEMEHADQLIARIVFLEGFPNLQKLDPLMIGESVREVLDADLKAEYRARALYREARDVAEEAEDYVSKDLFETLMHDEEGHIDFLETQIDLFDRIGAEEYGLLNATPADEAK